MLGRLYHRSPKFTIIIKSTITTIWYNEDMRKYPEKNKVGIFRKLRADDWLVNHYSAGKSFLDGSVITPATIIKPIYSYGHNYNKFGKEFSLFIWTNESDIAKITEHFETTVANLEEKDINIVDESERFAYLDADYKGEK